MIFSKQLQYTDNIHSTGNSPSASKFSYKNEKTSCGPFDHCDQITNPGAKWCREGGGPLRWRTSWSNIIFLSDLLFRQYEVVLHHMFLQILSKTCDEWPPHTERISSPTKNDALPICSLYQKTASFYTSLCSWICCLVAMIESTT